MRVRDEVIDRWADLLTDYCVGVRRGETIAVLSTPSARPLVSAVAKAVIVRGGLPLVRLELPELRAFFLERADEDQLEHLSAAAMVEAETADARIRIAAEEPAPALARVDPRRQAAHDRAREPLRRAARRKRWVSTQYPTAAYVADSGMEAAEYEAFVERALFLDRDDPEAAWKELGRRQAGLVEFMARVQTVQIEADGTDLTLSVDGRTWINSDGRRNMPSGEIFTGPIEGSARGRLRCGFPVRRDGRRLAGIALELNEGKVVAASAEEGEEYLRAMLDLDPGARRFGELGLGLNPGIDRFTGTILFDEKIGGTVHLALGQSYPETGGVNASALHWDLIIDTRAGGRLRADGRTVMENGQWLVG